VKVHIVCRVTGTRVLARQALDLVKFCGWSVGQFPRDDVDYNYAFPYMELRQFGKPFVALFTHREDCVPDKVKIWESQAKRAILRTTYCQKYKKQLENYGLTKVVTPAIDRNKFTISRVVSKSDKPIVGLSGFTYKGGRKGENLIVQLQKHPIFNEFEWRASGRGWPVTLTSYSWEDMQKFFQGLDLFLCSSLYEGVPYPVLEAMACGVRCIIPRDVGLLDELPDMVDLIRYERGNLESLIGALDTTLKMSRVVNQEQLRAATERFEVANWANDHLNAFALLEKNKKSYWVKKNDIEKDCGIYAVAYGSNARTCARRLINSSKKFMPHIPIALASSEPLGIEDYHISCPDLDLGGRYAKMKVCELAPKQWKYILYLDADIEIVADVSFLFKAVRDGWDIVATKDTDTGGFNRIEKLFSRDSKERELGLAKLGTGKFTAIAGGVFCFQRNDRVKRFFDEWVKEWKVLGRRDQGALLRAIMPNPVKILMLGNQWNSFTRYFDIRKTAGIVHHQQQARRWRGNYPDRLDSLHTIAQLEPRRISDKDSDGFFKMLAIKTFAGGSQLVRRNTEFVAVGWYAQQLINYKIAVCLGNKIDNFDSEKERRQIFTEV